MGQRHLCVGSFLVREDGTVDVEPKLQFFAPLDGGSPTLTSKLLVWTGKDDGFYSLIVADYVKNRVIYLRTGIPVQVSLWATEDDMN